MNVIFNGAISSYHSRNIRGGGGGDQLAHHLALLCSPMGI